MPDKPPLLFLHGAFAGPEIWTRFVAPWFAARGHAVAAPRLNGGEGARLRDYVARARTAADALGGTPVVVGHSLGGLVAQHLAAERRLAGAVLVSSPGPAGLGPSFAKLAMLSPDILGTLMLAQSGAGAALGAEAIRRALFTETTPNDWIAEVSQMLAPESPGALADAMTWDLPAWPLAWMVPTLAIAGDRDPIVPRADLWAVGLCYGAETEVFQGLGHGLPIDPAWKSLAWRINAWLDERRIRALGQVPLAKVGRVL